MTHRKYLVKLIESIIQSELEEIATSPKQAFDKKMALLAYDHGAAKDYVLYKIDEDPRYNKDRPEGKPRGVVKVFGMIHSRYKPECAANEITTVAAEQGFGPLMYHAAMSLGKTKYIMPDRFLVSEEAEEVWKRFFARNNVEKVLLPKDCHKRVDSENRFLNYKYALKSPMDFSSLLAASEDYVNNSELYGRSKENFIENVILRGKEFFSKKYD